MQLTSFLTLDFVAYLPIEKSFLLNCVVKKKICSIAYAQGNGPLRETTEGNYDETSKPLLEICSKLKILSGGKTIAIGEHVQK